MKTGMRAIVAILFAALFFFGLQAPAASAAGDVDLTVNVTTKAGTALSGIDVVAYEVENHTSDYENFVLGVPVSGKPGRYQLDDLEQNTDYALYFYVDSKNSTTFDQFYGGATWVEEATLLNWSSSGPVTLNTSLATNTTIAGKVSISSTKGLGSVRVTAYRFDGSGWFDVASVLSSSTGAYALRNLEPGSYRLGFRPDNRTGYLPRFSGGASSLATATSLNAGLGTTTTTNVSLSVGGKVSGSVGLGPIVNGAYTYVAEGIQPVAYRMLGDSGSGYHVDKGEFYLGPVVGSTGKWSVPGLPTGNYAIRLLDWSGLEPPYEPIWVSSGSGSDLVSGARIFAVTAPASVAASPATVMRSVDLQPGVEITSIDVKVENAAHDPIEAADVVLVSTDQNYVSQLEHSDGAGIASFNRIGEGAYRVEVTTDNSTTAYHPYIGTFTVSGTGDHVRTVTLAPTTAFSFTAPATVSWSNTAVGSEFDVTVPPTTMDNGSGVEQDVDYRYQWYRGTTAIFGANDEIYVTKSGDVGTEVSVVVTASTFGFADISEIAHAGAMTALGVAAVSSGIPVITSPVAAKPAVVLSASAGTWNLSGLRYKYQWKRDGVDIGGATSRTYTARPEDASHGLTVAVIATRPGLQDSTPAVSAPVAVGQLAAPVAIKNSVITATTAGLLAGQAKYTISMGTWNVPGATWHVNWYADGVQFVTPEISGANTQSFLYDPAVRTGQLIQAVVVVDKLGYTTATRSYIVRKGTAPAPSGGGVTTPWHSTPLTDTENVDWGTLLTAAPPALTYPNLTGNTIARAYQWQRLIGSTWTSITAATKTTYTLTTSDVGRKVRVRVITTSSQYGTDTSYFAAGIGALKWDIVGAAQPDAVITGSTDAGATKTAQVVGAWGAPSVTQSYRWFSCDPVTAPPGACDNAGVNAPWVLKATTASWTPPAALVGQRIAVEVKASKSGYVPLAVKSDAMDLTVLDEVSHLTGPKISVGLVSGQAATARKLTATPGTVDLAGAVRTYLWEFSDDAGASWNPVPDATNALSYAPTALFQAAHPAALIRFTETASKAGLPQSSTFPTTGYPLVPGVSAPTIKPTVSGNAVTGFVVNLGTWPAGTSIAVEWRENGGAPATTTGPHSFVPTIANSVVTATVVATRPGYTSAPIRLVARKGTAMFNTAPLNGASVADTFSAPGTGFSFGMGVPEATYSYQWYYNSTGLITGAKSPTFVPSSAYLSKNLTLRVTMTSPLYNTQVGVFGPTLVTLHPAATGSPSLTSTVAAKPGVKLSIALGAYSTTGLAFTYAIQRSANGGSTWTSVTAASSYTLTTADAGLLFRAVVTAKKAGWVTSVVNTGTVAIGWLGPLETVGPLTLTGSGAVGSVLSVVPVWNTTSVTATYVWVRNGVTIPGVTGSTYTPLATAFGDEIQVAVLASKAGYQPVTITSDLVRVGVALAPAPSVLPVIAGATGGTNKPKVGNLLSASTGVWNVDGLTFGYQWRANGIDIPGATGSSYAVTGTELGKLITVIVTAEKTGWTDGVSASKPTLAVIP